MKLSEAILKGCESGPKAKGDLRDRDGGLCAFGAALVAETGSAEWGARCRCGHIGDDCPGGLCPVDSFTDNLGWLRIEMKVTHPVTGLPDKLGYVVIDLNNNRDWSREAIAMWVESVEKAMEAEKPEPAVEEGYVFPGRCQPCVVQRLKRGPEQVCVGGHASLRNIQRRWRLLLEDLGLYKYGRGIHSLRHTAITEMYKLTRDLRKAQVFAGHSNSAITERYAHVVDMQESLNDMPRMF